jgi:hypothetical protein
MGKSSPSPPPAPDYAGAAREQGAANVETARLQGRINNPNVSGPLGGQTVTWGSPTFNQSGYDSAMAAYQAKPRGNAPYERQFTTQDEDGSRFDETGYQNAMNAYMSGNIAPTRDQFTSNANSDQATITQTLTPQAQATLEAQQRVQRSLAGLGEQGIGTAQNVLSNAFNPNLQGLQTNIGNAGQISNNPNLAGYGTASGGPSAGQYGYAGGLNTGNVAAMPVNAGMTGQQAIMSRLAPQLERSDRATQQRLANQGLVPGGEAFENAMISQNQQKNDLLTQAALQGIGLDTAANAQGFNQALQAGQYGNQAIGQNFGQGQAANAAQNQAINQNQQTALAQQQAVNAAQNQQYNQLLQGAQFGNTAQQQSLQQQLALRNQPLNEIAGLMSGSQIQMPQFQGYQGANVAGTPIMQGAMAQGQAAMDQYGIQSANVNAQNAGLYNLAGSAGMAFAF